MFHASCTFRLASPRDIAAAALMLLCLLVTSATVAEDQGARRHAQGSYDPATATYEVAAGDDLSDIAARFGVSLADLKAKNDLSADVIDAGQRLEIPGQGMPAAAGAASAGAAGYQVISGTMGAPGATATISGEQLPAPAPPFGGVIKDDALSSTPWWAPRIAPPKQAPNILLIITDDAGFGVPSTFGGVIPTPTMD
ncbi:LysM peptidoglycan-binding domain-containing protein, partial [Thiohalocapsa sp.]|uniref:LysM peptidoglycan-binding domain-containing protein n=1 Tax=Thiohalocapsa sp. TaxID=2497641 RepID=UPI0025E2C362